MDDIKILSELFRGSESTGSRMLSISGNRLCVNKAAPRGLYHSNARRRTEAIPNSAKISQAAAVLDLILRGRIAALEGRDDKKIYAEIITDSGDRIRVNWPDRKMYWSEETKSAEFKCVPFVLMALHRDSKMAETRDLFGRCVSDFVASGVVSDENLFQFCDAFYYEWKEYNTIDSVSADCYLNDDTVRQAIRTGSLQEFSLFRETGCSTAEILVAEVPTNNGPVQKNDTIDPNARYEKCKKGEYVIDYCWSPEQMTHIPEPAYLDNYVPVQQFWDLVDLIQSEMKEVTDRLNEGLDGIKAIQDNYVNAILVGKPGTGKTTLANALAATFQVPLRVVAPNRHSEEDLFTGMTKVSNGGFAFHETPFLDAYKNGGIILLEEFNLADQGVIQGALGQAVEKPFILAQDGHMEVRRHPLCIIIATMNSGVQGAREPSEAFTSRFPYTVRLEDPTQEEFVSILQSKGYKQKDCKQVYNVYGKCINAVKMRNAEDILYVITVRQCIAALKWWRKINHSLKDAIDKTMIGAIATKDSTLAQEIYDAVVTTLPNV